jgi:predicted O-linked N-acetylglucosamine transferase (SPINDLY family)
MQKQQHLARLQFADVILDSFIYNAHTTTTDALWAGVPVVTLTGETFASRVATSLVSAVGLSELATQSPTDYVSLAVELGSNQQRLESLKSRLRNKIEKPLFSTARYVKNLDDAYKEMFDRRLRALL